MRKTFNVSEGLHLSTMTNQEYMWDAWQPFRVMNHLKKTEVDGENILVTGFSEGPRTDKISI